MKIHRVLIENAQGILRMSRYQLISTNDRKILSESDSYSFILYASKRYRKLEVDFKIIDIYTGSVKEAFNPVII